MLHSKGLTLDRVRMDLGTVFEEGMAYVALSRCRSLEGIQLDSFKASTIRASHDVSVQRVAVPSSPCLAPPPCPFPQPSLPFRIPLLSSLTTRLFREDMLSLFACLSPSPPAMCRCACHRLLIPACFLPHLHLFSD